MTLLGSLPSGTRIMIRILKVPFVPFLIFRDKKALPMGLGALSTCWVLFLTLELSYAPDLARMMESGVYEMSDPKKGRETISMFEWYLRATLGKVFDLFHWWIHFSVLFSLFTQYLLEVEAKENPGREHHSKIFLAFLCIFPLSWYMIIFFTIDWWFVLISFLISSS